jgi:hypothetical protein
MKNDRAPGKEDFSNRLPHLKHEWDTTGLIRDTFPLADTSVIPGLLADLPMYRTEIVRNRQDELFRIPYLLTESIIRAAYDPNILAVVSELLGTDELVMWGPNIQSGTPNEADLWHTDVEAWLWPSVSVFVGLEGCTLENTTKCIPHSFKAPAQPWFAANNRSDAATLEAARALCTDCTEIARFRGFGDGRFYVFNAKCWHAGVQQASVGRKMLFFHYDKASNPRMPYMKNYIERTWFDYPAVYLPIKAERDFLVNRQLHDIRGKDYNGVLPPGFRFVDA